MHVYSQQTITTYCGSARVSPLKVQFESWSFRIARWKYPLSKSNLLQPKIDNERTTAELDAVSRRRSVTARLSQLAAMGCGPSAPERTHNVRGGIKENVSHDSVSLNHVSLKAETLPKLVFHAVLADKRATQEFLKFTQAEFSSENLEFYLARLCSRSGIWPCPRVPECRCSQEACRHKGQGGVSHCAMVFSSYSPR